MRPAFRCLLAILVLLWAAGAGAQPAGQAQPPERPFLRIETGMHTAAIRRMVATPDGSALVTVSEDKTIRVWGLDGALLRTLRVPLGPAAEGALYAVALAPDGQTLAVGGATGLSWSDSSKVYFFSLATGRMVRRPLSLGSTAISALAFSPDGDRIAIGFTRGQGLALVDLAGNHLINSDRNYQAQVTGLAFDPAGNIVAGGLDGMVRLYRPDLTLQRRVALPQGGQAGDLALSPDGRLLAVGVANRPEVRLLDARTLELLATPPLGTALQRMTQNHLAAVAWATELAGVSLYAAGHVMDRDGNYLVLRWQRPDRPPVAQAAVARDTVMQLLGLGPRGVAYIAADTAFGLLGPALRPRLQQRSDIGDFRNLAHGTFRLAPDGMTVEFGMDQAGRNPLRFSVAARLLERATGLPPSRAALNLPLRNWENGASPLLGNRPLPLDPGELSRSAAVAPDGRSFVLGTDTHLRIFAADGTPLAQVPVPATVWGVLYAPSAPLLVAALGDGTLRWLGLRPGQPPQEWAALFPHRDGRRWVLWTPEGFFDHADEGGQELVGYALNAGPNVAPEWLTFAQLYRLFYAPGLVRGRLTSGDDTALRQRLAQIGDVRRFLRQAPPPVVNLEELCFAEPGTGRQVCERLERFATTPGPARGLARVVEASSERPVAGTATPGGVTLPPGVLKVRLRAVLLDRGGGLGGVDLFLNDRNINRLRDTRGLSRIEVGVVPGADSPAAPGKPAPLAPSGVAPGAGPGTGPLAAPGKPAPLPSPGASPVPDMRPPGPVGLQGTIATGLLRYEHRLTLDPGVNRILLRAYDGANTIYAQSATLEIATAPVREERPTLHVLAVGVDDYHLPGLGFRPLRFAGADARSFGETVRQRVAADYADVNLVLLRDSAATRAGIEAALERLAETARPQDTALIYLAGHGVLQSGTYEFIPYLPEAADPVRLNDLLLPDSRLLELWSRLPARNSFLLLDTCHAGALSLEFVGRLAHESGRYVLAAASSVEEALDGFDGRNGPFAVAVMEALRGQTRIRTSSAIDQMTIGLHVQLRLPELVRQRNPLHRQRAEFKQGTHGGVLQPFPIARLQ